MLEKLAKQLNMFEHKFFKTSEIKDDVLFLKVDSQIAESMLMSEIVDISKEIDNNLFDYHYNNRQIEIRIKPVYETITDEIKDAMSDRKAIFPKEYSELFISIARERKIELKDEDLPLDMLENRIMDHAQKLGGFAENAIKAMQNGDKKGLHETIDNTETLRRQIVQLQAGLYEDALTKVYNRKWMDDTYLGKSGGHFTKNGTLVIVDINNLKYINDNFGHTYGDKVILIIASYLKRSGAKVVRYGGDDFFLFFGEEVDKSEINNRMHMLQEIVLKKKLSAQGFEFSVSFSYGISTFKANGSTVSVIAEAEQMMYANKKILKNRLK